MVKSKDFTMAFKNGGGEAYAPHALQMTRRLCLVQSENFGL